MIINYKKSQYYVIAKIIFTNKIQYITYMENGNILLLNCTDEIKEFGNFIYGYNTDENTISEYKNIGKDIYYSIYADDYSSEQQRENYKEIKQQILKGYLRLKKEILKDYYIDKIRCNELELWKNNLDNLVYEIKGNEYYINDKDFDIFYKIKDNQNYDFKFIDK